MKKIIKPENPVDATDWFGIKLHRVATKTPPSNEDDYRRLKASVLKEGLLFLPIFDEDRLVDGRDRCRACIELGRDFGRRQWSDVKRELPEGITLEDWIYSVNLARKHAEIDQIVASAVLLNAEKVMQEALERRASGRPKAVIPTPNTPATNVARIQTTDGGPSDRILSDRYSLPLRKVRQALKLYRNSPEKLQAVLEGKISLVHACRSVVLPRPTVVKDTTRLRRKAQQIAERLVPWDRQFLLFCIAEKHLPLQFHDAAEKEAFKTAFIKYVDEAALFDSEPSSTDPSSPQP